MTDRAAYVEPGTIGPTCPPAHRHSPACPDTCTQPLRCQHPTCRAIRNAEDGTARRVIAFLRRNVAAIAQDEAAGRIAHDIGRLRARVETAIDNREPDVYYGPCQADAVETTEVDGEIRTRLLPGVKCGADLIGELGADYVQCRDCRSIWRTDELQDRLTKATRDAWARPAVIVDALRARGESITLERLKNWISRDKAEQEAGRRRRVPYPPILPVGVEEQFDGDGRPIMTPLLDDGGEPKRDEAGRPILVQATKPVYRLGDVLDRIEALAASSRHDEREKARDRTDGVPDGQAGRAGSAGEGGTPRPMAADASTQGPWGRLPH